MYKKNSLFWTIILLLSTIVVCEAKPASISVMIYPAYTNENSDYLYYDQINNRGYYSDEMGDNPQEFNVSILVESSSEVIHANDNSTFGGDPFPQNKGNGRYLFRYQITAVDAECGGIIIEYFVTNIDGEWNKAFFYFVLDSIPVSNTTTFVSNVTITESYWTTIYGSGERHDVQANLVFFIGFVLGSVFIGVIVIVLRRSEANVQ